MMLCTCPVSTRINFFDPCFRRSATDNNNNVSTTILVQGYFFRRQDLQCTTSDPGTQKEVGKGGREQSPISTVRLSIEYASGPASMYGQSGCARPILSPFSLFHSAPILFWKL